LQAAGAVTLGAIAAALDGGSWSANQVSRLLKNIASPFASATTTAGIA